MPLIEAICRSYRRAGNTVARLRRRRVRGFISAETDPVLDERAREREREGSPAGSLPTVSHHHNRPPPSPPLVQRPSQGSSWRWRPENRFSDRLEFQAFARKRIPPIKRESRAIAREVVPVGSRVRAAMLLHNRPAILGDTHTNGRDIPRGTQGRSSVRTSARP